ncbi:MAG: hypothetical protein QXT26_07935 [Thermoproteota archaeon]
MTKNPDWRESKILARHRYVPKNEIYHLTDNLLEILMDDALYVRVGGMLSLTANPKLKVIFPETTPRRYRLVLDFKGVKRDFNIFPVYYFTESEFYRKKPYGWLVSYYVEKGLKREEVDNWQNPLVYIMAEPPMAHESEWKSIRNIAPLSKYLIRIEVVR